MGINIYILNASGNLTSHKDILRKYTRLAVRKVQRKITLNNIDIVIRESENPESYKDIDGIGGYCPNGNFVQLSIDLNHPSILTSPGKVIETTLIHELHHAARIQAGILFTQGSFIEYMFSEGLADYFVYELTEGIGEWIIKLNQEDKIRLLEMVNKIRNKLFTNKDHQDWFVKGSVSQRIPQFSGYTIGFELVKNYFIKNPDKSATSLVSTSVEDIPHLLE